MIELINANPVDFIVGLLTTIAGIIGTFGGILIWLFKSLTGEVRLLRESFGRHLEDQAEKDLEATRERVQLESKVKIVESKVDRLETVVSLGGRRSIDHVPIDDLIKFLNKKKEEDEARRAQVEQD